MAAGWSIFSGAMSDKAFIRDLQWDTFGLHVLHVDFSRISEHEVVEVVVAIELRGEAPGVREGGVIKLSIHEVSLQVQATAIPDKLFVSVNHLKLGDSITVAQVEIPQAPRSSWIPRKSWSSAYSRRSRWKRRPRSHCRASPK